MKDRVVRIIRFFRHIAFILITVSYLAATILKSDFWGNILSPIVSFIIFHIIFYAFYMEKEKGISRISGLFMAVGILFWTGAEFLWAVFEMLLKINPFESEVISYCYAFTNIFFILSFALYSIKEFRRWNIVQILIDTVILSYFIINLTWIAFLDEDVRNIIELRGDWISSACIILDILLITLIAVWYMSVRSGRIPVILRYVSAGLLLFSIITLFSKSLVFMKKVQAAVEELE
jgi:hypothetical protein